MNFSSVKKLFRWFGRDSTITRGREEILNELERKIGYRFKNMKLLDTALSHRSFTYESGKNSLDSYERLEFLGDAVLGLVVSENVYDRFSDSLEGELTKRKSSLVSKSSLSERAEDLGLNKYVLVSGNEDLMNGRSRKTILADSFEAVLGALYLDGGFQTVSRFLRWVLLDKLDDIFNEGDLDFSKSALLEKVQKKYHSQPVYRIVKTKGPEHRKIFHCEVEVDGTKVGFGNGLSKKDAEKRAAQEALKVIDEMD